MLVLWRQGCQVLLDLLVSCDGDFAVAAEKMRMTEQRFRRLLNQNIHVKHYVKIYKDFKVRPQRASLLTRHLRPASLFPKSVAISISSVCTGQPGEALLPAVETEASVGQSLHDFG